MMELIERRVVASQKVGVRLYFSQIDLVILILVPVRRNGQPLVWVMRRVSTIHLQLIGQERCARFAGSGFVWSSIGSIHTLNKMKTYE